MRTLNPGNQTCRRNGVIGVGLLPEDRSTSTINVKVTHRHNRYQLVVPFNSTFGYLKSIIAETLGLNPEMHKLLFRGKELEDAEYLQTAGVTDNSEIIITENTTYEQHIPSEYVEQTSTSVVSKGEDAVAEVRKEVDKLEREVSTLRGVLDGGSKVDDKEIIYLTEMLMRQLLKLDGVEAEGEGRVKRKVEVRRVQSLVETLDALKARNSNKLVVNC